MHSSYSDLSVLVVDDVRAMRAIIRSLLQTLGVPTYHGPDRRRGILKTHEASRDR